MGMFEDDLDQATKWFGGVKLVREWLIANRGSIEREGVVLSLRMVVDALKGKVEPAQVLEAAKLEGWHPTDGRAEIDCLTPPSRDGWHCMIDLETWGLPPNGLIVSIGAVMFDPERNIITDRFHVGIDPEISVQWGFDIQPGTMMWWLDPKRDAARQAWLKLPKVDLASALSMFGDWYGVKTVPTWGNGADFDLTLMTNAFKKLSINVPWKYYDVNCYRTLKKRVEVEKPVTGLHHDALDDARWQSEHLMRILAQMKMYEDHYKNGKP